MALTRASFAPYMDKTVAGDIITYNFYTGWVTGSTATRYATVLSEYPGFLIPGSTPLYHPSYGAEDPAFNDNSDKFTYEHPASEDNPTYIIAKLTKGGVTKFHGCTSSEPSGWRPRARI